MTDKEKLLSILKVLSYKEGTFTLKSGRESDFYIDCRLTSLHPEGGFLCGVAMHEVIQKNFPDAVAVVGVPTGAIPLATSVCNRSHQVGKRPLPQILVRKEAKSHGADPGSRLVNHMQFEKDDGSIQGEVVLLEDVTTTGGSVIEVADLLEDAGFEVIGIVTLVDRLEGSREAIEHAGYDVVSVFTRKDVKGE